MRASQNQNTWHHWIAFVAMISVYAGSTSRLLGDSGTESASTASRMNQVFSTQSIMRLPDGHPVIQGIVPGGSPLSTGAIVPTPEPQLPLAKGTFVNFESPQVKPLALSSDGSILLATNTPNNSLVVIDTVSTPMQRINEIAVGLDPVSVAIQPGTGDKLAWVANFISDNISVVDLSLGTVVSVIEVGDEPVNILFDATGTFAFVVIQGSPADVGIGPIVQEGQLIAVDTATRQVVSHVFLDCNTPRAAVYDVANNQVIVAALHSGNNTTVVGEPVSFQPVTGPPVPVPLLWAAQNFSQTGAIFASSPELGPNWPDLHANANLPPAPLVQRIVFDQSGGWQQIVNVLSIIDGFGNLIPNPAMVSMMNAEFGIINADEVIQAIINDAKDTLDHDLVVVDVSDPAGVGLSPVNKLGGVGTTLTGMGMNPSGELFVSNLEPLNTARLEPNLRGHFIDHQIVIVINPQSPGALIVPTNLHDGIPNFNNVSVSNPLAQQLSLANPTDIVFDAFGTTAYVAALGVGRVAALHGTTASVIGRVDVGRGPRGLVLDSATNRLYVMNRTDMTLNAIDVSDPANMNVVGQIDLFNPEPPVIKNGRDFLYTTRLTNNFASSCAMCHIDGTLDHLAWDLGDPIGGLQPPPPNLPNLNNHPLKGPMVTLSLQGLDRHEPLHWRGDHPIFQDFNSAIDSLLGGSQIPPDAMNAFAAFAKTINYNPNPFRNRDDSFKDSNAGVGLNQFLISCDVCHQVRHGGALSGTTGDQGISLAGPPIFAQLELVTQLRGLYKKLNSDVYNGFGLIHDGREERETTLPPVVCPGPGGTSLLVPACTHNPLCTFIRTFFSGMYCTPGLVDGIIAYSNAFPSNVKPVVGWQVKPSSPIAIPDTAAINLMIAQSTMIPSRNDVIAKGLVNGQPRGYVLIAADPATLFESDLGELLTLGDLFTLINGGAQLVFSAVPPGSGRRIGIDQDLDGIGDGLDPMPQFNNDADVNLNGLADGLDIQPFLSVIFDPPGATVQAFNAADANNDHFVDILDVTTVINILLSGGQP